MGRIKIVISLLAIILFSACNGEQALDPVPIDREQLIPEDHIKMVPEMDIYPPVSETDEYENPVPLPYPINTAGGEDSPFILPDGRTLYFFFTPDVNIRHEEQLTDGVTGIYVSHKEDGVWTNPERVALQDPGKLALDGCEFVLGNVMWFCSAREGFTGLHWFTAEFIDGGWQNWQLADFKQEYEVGELHISSDGSELYFHSSRPGGKGEFDIWVSKWVDGGWLEPENVEIVNSSAADGWPFISQDGEELWFTRIESAPVLFRSLRVNGEWGEPERMFSNFAGEPTLDLDGNVYFTHHFYNDGLMIEADIYFAEKK